MSTEPSAQNEAVSPAAAADTDGHAGAFPPASPEQIYARVMIRLAVITEEWQQARDALRRGIAR